MNSRREPSHTLDGTSGIGDVDALAEMRSTMDELHHHNQKLEDNIHNNIQHQYDSNPLEEMELLDPHSFSDNI